MNQSSFEQLFTTQEDPWFINSRLSQHKRYVHAIKLIQKLTQHIRKTL